MSQSSYSLRPRKQLDYAVLQDGKHVQYPLYGFSPWMHKLNHEASPVGNTSSPAEWTGEFQELQELLVKAEAQNQVLKQNQQFAQTRQDLEALHAWNAEQEGKRPVHGRYPQQASEAKPVYSIQELRQKPSLTTQVDSFLNTLNNSSSDEDSDDKRKDSNHSSRGRVIGNMYHQRNP